MKYRIFGSLILLVAAAQVQAATVSPTKSNGDFISGTGIPADNFTVSTAAGGESVALKARDRDTGQALSVVGNVYTVPLGLDDLNTNPAWVFDYQFSPGLTGAAADQYILSLMVDFDPGVGVTSFTSISLPIGDADATVTNSWDDGDGFFLNSSWSDATPYVVSNSWHLNFSFWDALGATPDYNPYVAGGEYEIRLLAFNLGEQLLAQTTVFAVVVPEPSSIGLLAIGTVAIGLVALKRRRSK